MFNQLPRAAKLGGGALLGVAGLAAGTVAYANDDTIHPSSFPWAHYGMFSAFDHSDTSLRYTSRCHHNQHESKHELD